MRTRERTRSGKSSASICARAEPAETPACTSSSARTPDSRRAGPALEPGRADVANKAEANDRLGVVSAGIYD
jgi:hypothetical protein